MHIDVQGGAVFSIEQLVQQCRAALTTADPGEAVRGLVADALREPDAVLAALGDAPSIGLTTYASEPGLTVQRIVWGPGITSTVHEHGVWVVAGVYAGAELNVRYEVHDEQVVERERVRVGRGSALLLRAEEAHAVVGSGEELTQALHVYGGDIATLPRREWIDGVPRPFDVSDTVVAASAYNAWMAAHGRLPTADEGADLLRAAGYPLPALQPTS